MKYLLTLCLSLISLIGTSQSSITGIWKSYNKDTGKLDSEVEIFIKNGKLYGKLVKLYNPDGTTRNPRCTKCKGKRKNQPLEGMIFITGLVKSGNSWTGDNAMLYPKTGKEYTAKIWLESDNKLAVRGYLGIFYETRYWKR